MPAEPMEYPPMLPLIAHDAKFIFCTDIELQQFASNAALVAQLSDSLSCWLSHLEDIKHEVTEFLDELDKAPTIDLVHVEPKLINLELTLSFFLHFDRKEVTACIRLLQQVPQALPALARLNHELEANKAQHEEIVRTLSFVSGVVVYLKNPWNVKDLADSFPPLFSALRALWVCSELFSPAHIHRFSAAFVHVVQRTEQTVHDATYDVMDRFVDAPSKATVLKEALVSSQDAIVSIQECFYELRTSLSSSGVYGKSHIIFSDVDDEAIFSLLEWQFERLGGLNQMIDILKRDLNKVGSALTDPVTSVDLMNPDVMPQPVFLKHLGAIEREEAPSADTILARMSDKAAAASQKSKSAALLAPRAPFDKLTSHLVVMVDFNPPVLTLIGGPVSASFLDAAQYTLPMCCSNTQVRCVARKAPDPIFICIGPNIQQLKIYDQFCDEEIHVSHFLLTILDLLEAEDAWKMCDVSGLHLEGCERHVMHFRKHRSKKRRPGQQQKADDPVVDEVDETL